jgi:hypothetical protein
MENKDMIDKLEDHEKRLSVVEILTEYQSRDIKSNQHDLTRLVTNNNKLQIIVAVLVGSYLGFDKVIELATKFIGG